MDEATFAALRLSTEGRGSFREIMETPVNVVMDMIHFSRFCADWDHTHLHLNKEKK